MNGPSQSSPFPVGRPSGRPTSSEREREFDFANQLAAGTKGEQFLDELFSRWYEIFDFSTQGAEFQRYLQQLGVDRLWISKRPERWRYLVEYKTDITAGQTGNAFIETMSVDKREKRGWSYSSVANLLVYYLPDSGEVWGIPMMTIKSRVQAWEKTYPIKRIENKDYTTVGVVVPLLEMKRISWQFLRVNSAGNVVRSFSNTPGEPGPAASQMRAAVSDDGGSVEPGPEEGPDCFPTDDPLWNMESYAGIIPGMEISEIPAEPETPTVEVITRRDKPARTVSADAADDENPYPDDPVRAMLWKKKRDLERGKGKAA